MAFVYGSMARSKEMSKRDIDLLVVGTVGLADLVPVLRSVERSLGRPTNPSIYAPEDFRRKVRKRDHLLSAVLAGAREFVKGNEHELAAILGKG